MDYQIAYDSDNGLIRIVLVGKGTQEEVKTVVMTCLQLAQTHQCRNFLLDARELVGEDSPVNAYQIAQLYEQVVDRRFREAIIAPRDGVTAASMAFFETAAQNRGFQVQLFQEESEAIAWLKNRP